MPQLRFPFAVFYITPKGESDCEGVYVAKSEEAAIAAFVKETGPDEFEWEAHRLSAWNSKAWCEGYAESMADAEDRVELAAREKRLAEERRVACVSGKKKR